jgi:UDP-2,3-diacylglucosamine pyrophosphatase LpxH
VSLSYRTLWLSDIHLGTPASRAEDLLNFLDDVSADRIYLNGDIVDLERMQRRALFSDVQQRALRRIFELARSGTEVIYIPGNHDIQFRGLIGQHINGIPVQLEAIHKTRDGRNLLVTHGDLFDGPIRLGTSLGQFGAAAYGVLVALDVLVNQFGSKHGYDYVSLGAHIKKRLSAANTYIRRFEEIAAQHAAERQFDGIVCGHIHKPCIRTIGNICYANDGDWVEHRSALAESHDGSLQILQWQTNEVVATELPAALPLAA